MTTKTALITGAAAGIGRARAIALANEGIAVGVLDLNLQAAVKSKCITPPPKAR